MINYIVLDLEWNQSPRGKEGSVAYLPFEIIEIGAVKLNEQRQMTGEFHRLVKPCVYRQMHYMISEVTHMDMTELRRDGAEFATAVTEFLEWCGDDAVFCTWGPQDMTELQRNMTFYDVEIPWGVPLLYYDVQKLFSLLYGDGKQKPSLDSAVELLGLEEDRPFHRALDDAYYAGRVLGDMDFEAVKAYVSMDYYRLPKDRAEEVYLTFPNYTKYVSRPFETKEDAVKDRFVTELKCCVCNRALRKKIRWFSVNQRVYLAMGICPEHGFVKGKIRLKKMEDGQVFAVRTVKLTTEEWCRRLQDKKEEIRRRRREKRHL